MKAIADLLALKDGDLAAIIGCGGKTTLLWGLARHYRARRVLVGTTTKIGWPPADFYDSLTHAAEIDRLLPPAQIPPGVHLAGTLYEDKLHIKSLPLSDLEAVHPSFDLVLLEADGSRNLPVKGWAEHEPVIPACASVSIGVATISAEGQPVDERCVHRPDIFCAISGAKPGEAISLAHLAAAAAHPKGLMRRARGRKVLIINQLDDEAALERARAFTALLPADFLAGLHLVMGASFLRGFATPLWVTH